MSIDLRKTRYQTRSENPLIYLQLVIEQLFKNKALILQVMREWTYLGTVLNVVLHYDGEHHKEDSDLSYDG